MKKEKIVVGVMVLCLIVIVSSTTYAFFKARISGEGANLEVIIGETNLLIERSEITVNSIIPILDSTRNEKANTNEFTITKQSNNNSELCYDIYIVIDKIGSGLNNKWFKYEIEYGDGKTASGDFSSVEVGNNNTYKIKILKNQIMGKNVESLDYKLKLWFSYSSEEDQTEYLTGNEESRTFEGHINVSGKTGSCPKVTLASQILEDNILKGTRTNFESVLPAGADDGSYDESQDTESGLYKEDNLLFTEDTNGDGKGEEVYYFAGNVKNNWVKFANYYWRIIRTNEDGGVRLLFAGETPDTESGYISSKSFNSSDGDPMLVGFKYGESGSLESNRLNTHNSTILGNDEGTDEGSLNWWYKNKIQDLGFDDYVSKTAIYCNDRSVTPGKTYSTEQSFEYASEYRTYRNKRPSFKCGIDIEGNVIEETQNVADKFSVDESSGGNGQLKYPVGLMTADELAFSGMVDTAPMKENRYWYGYLNSVLTSVVGENEWWLISPVRFDWDRYGETIGKVFNGDRARVENVSIRGSFHIVRPVISLKSCVEYSKGNGLSDSPYEVSIDESCKLAVN